MHTTNSHNSDTAVQYNPTYPSLGLGWAGVGRVGLSFLSLSPAEPSPAERLTHHDFEGVVVSVLGNLLTPLVQQGRRTNDEGGLTLVGLVGEDGGQLTTARW